MDTKIKKFNGLNELRALAAIAVIFHHIELFKFRDHIPSLYGYLEYFISHLGKNAVYLFFVLSGFLITYLLFLEKSEFKTIFLKKFYLRRIYRIWPLYYTVLLISVFLIPFLVNMFQVFELTPYYYNLITDSSNYTWESMLMYFTFLPNIALKHGFSIPGASQSWSIGVEEQFYLLWPLLLLFFNRKTIPYVFILFLLWPFLNILNHFVDLPHNLLIIVKAIPFEFLAIGSIGAFCYYHYSGYILKYTKSKYISLLTYSVIFILLMFPVIHLFFQKLIIGVLFLVLIFVAIDDRNKLSLRNPFLFKLGKISYGIYMYHPFVMFLIFPLLNKYFLSFSLWYYNLLAYFLIIGLTIIISHFSYEFLEKKFIIIKNNKYKLVK